MTGHASSNDPNGSTRTRWLDPLRPNNRTMEPVCSACDTILPKAVTDRLNFVKDYLVERIMSWR